MKYTCECGKEFSNPQQFNGHKSHCKVHAEACDKLADYIERNKTITKAATLAHSAKLKEVKLEEQQRWVDEQHVCEHCGKIMLTKYGSGRFCSRACANSRTFSDYTKKRIQQTCLSHSVTTEERQQAYQANPNKCVVCGEVLPFEKRFRKTCSKECLSAFREKLKGDYALWLANNPQHGMPRGNYKYGYYQDIWCDSSWELAFLVYH